MGKPLDILKGVLCTAQSVALAAIVDLVLNPRPPPPVYWSLPINTARYDYLSTVKILTNYHCPPFLTIMHSFELYRLVNNTKLVKFPEYYDPITWKRVRALTQSILAGKVEYWNIDNIGVEERIKKVNDSYIQAWDVSPRGGDWWNRSIQASRKPYLGDSLAVTVDNVFTSAGSDCVAVMVVEIEEVFKQTNWLVYYPVSRDELI